MAARALYVFRSSRPPNNSGTTSRVRRFGFAAVDSGLQSTLFGPRLVGNVCLNTYVGAVRGTGRMRLFKQSEGAAWNNECGGGAIYRENNRAVRHRLSMPDTTKFPLTY